MSMKTPFSSFGSQDSISITGASRGVAVKQAAGKAPRFVSFWQLGEQVTGGRWFELYRAAPKTLNEIDTYDYVVKLINPQLSAEDRSVAIQRMAHEAVSTDVVDHRSVIPLLDSELDNKPFFIVQPWIAGGSLDKFLALADNVSLTRMLWIIRQIGEALVAAHEKGRVHLGLEPSHVLVGNGGRVSLIGWSNSLAIDEVLDTGETGFQLARFRAPECFDPGYPAKTAADIYSLGLFIYQGLGGTTPFRGTDVREIAAAHRDVEPAALIRHQPLCPARLSDLVQWMLNKNPCDRPTSREVLDQLISIEIENLSNPALIQY